MSCYLARKTFSIESVLRSSVVFASKMNMKLLQGISAIQATPCKFCCSFVLINDKCGSVTIVFECPSNQASRVVEGHFQSRQISVFHSACFDVDWGLAAMAALLPFLVPIWWTRHCGEMKVVCFYS